MTREIIINNKATANANGVHSNGHCKPVVRLYPFKVYTSALDAVKDPENNISYCALTTICRNEHVYKRNAKGNNFCYLENLNSKLDCMQEKYGNVDELLNKAKAYDAIMAEREEAEKERKRKEAERQAKIDKKNKLKERIERRERIYERELAKIQYMKENIVATKMELHELEKELEEADE